MTSLAPGVSLSLRCVGSPDHPGNRLLNGDTVAASVNLAPNTGEPYSGARWYVVGLDSGSGDVALQCLGDLAGNRYLDGRTGDGVGSVGLAPGTAEPFSGTHWQVLDDGAGAVILQCMGEIHDPRFVFLNGRTDDASVGLAPGFDAPFTGAHWTPVDIVDHTTSPTSFNTPALTYSVDGADVFGVAMAWAGLDGRVNVQAFVGSNPPADVTMLADVVVDRPALTVHRDQLILAFTAPDGAIHVMASSDGHVFDTVTVLGVNTRLGPGVASFGGNIVVAWADQPGGQIHLLDIDANVQVDLPDTTPFAPALLGVVVGPARDNYLHLAWTGTDAARSLNSRRALTTLTNIQDDRGKLTLPDTSIGGPALAWREDVNSGLPPNLVMGWTGQPGGPDQGTHLNVSYSNQGVGNWDFKRTVASTSNSGPALIYYNLTVDPTAGTLLTAWVEPITRFPTFRIDVANFDGLPVIPT